MIDPLDTKSQYTGRNFLSCDWGTSSFRLKLVETETANILTEISNDEGIKKIYKRWSKKEKSENRIGYYLSFLKEKNSELEKKAQQKIDHLPILISGMASSSIGIKELPYRSLPIALDKPDLYMEVIEATDQFPHKLYLISGVRSTDDIMRGEETQMIGLSSKSDVRNGLCLLLGTHSKHIFIEDNAIIKFKTYMTGELFDLLSTKSILSNSVAEKKESVPGCAFEKGINDSIQKNVLHSLFKIRANDILKKSKDTESYDYLSGLLIGTELKEIWNNKPEHILLWGSSRLEKYYAAALEILNLNYTQTNVGPNEDITSLGHRTILKKINN